jgi:hypothetical protein
LRKESRWGEAQDKIVHLPAEDPEAFELWLHHAYTGNLAIKDKEREKSREYILLVKTYVLADYLLDIGVQKECIGMFLVRMRTKQDDGMNYFPGVWPIQYLYAESRKGDPMRKLIVDTYAQEATESFFEGGGEDLPREFLLELCVASVKLKPRKKKLGTAKLSVMRCLHQYYTDLCIPTANRELAPSSF